MEQSTSIKSPSLASDDLKYIEEQAELWKNSDRKIKIEITKNIRKKYSQDSEEYEYFCSIKMTKKKDTVERKTPNYKTKTGKERLLFGEYFASILKEHFYTQDRYDAKEGLFLVDKNYNLPSYFWIRMTKDVLPDWKQKNDIEERKAWLLAKLIVIQHKKELIELLHKINFKNLNHLSNVVIQFLNKYILTTYMDLQKKIREQELEKIKQEENIKRDQEIPQYIPQKKLGTIKKKRKNEQIGWL